MGHANWRNESRPTESGKLVTDSVAKAATVGWAPPRDWENTPLTVWSVSERHSR